MTRDSSISSVQMTHSENSCCIPSFESAYNNPSLQHWETLDALTRAIFNVFKKTPVDFDFIFWRWNILRFFRKNKKTKKKRIISVLNGSKRGHTISSPFSFLCWYSWRPGASVFSETQPPPVHKKIQSETEWQAHAHTSFCVLYEGEREEKKNPHWNLFCLRGKTAPWKEDKIWKEKMMDRTSRLWWMNPSSPRCCVLLLLQLTVHTQSDRHFLWLGSIAEKASLFS